MKEYTAHFIPCKVRYTGPTSEFVDNFDHHDKNDQSLAKEDDATDKKVNFEVRYLRGRKLIGRPVMESADTQAFLVKRATEDENSSGSTSMALQCTAKVRTLINYERDGNDERLLEEMAKFQEHLEIANIIHS